MRVQRNVRGMQTVPADAVSPLRETGLRALPDRSLRCQKNGMSVRLLVLTATLPLCGCGHKGARSLVGDFTAPGTYALAGDTITVWKRIRQPDGAWRFHSYSITPGATVEYLEEVERVGAPETAP